MGCVCAGPQPYNEDDHDTESCSMDEVFQLNIEGNVEEILVSAGQLERIWSRVDRNDSGFLDEKEVESMIRNFLHLGKEHFSNEELQTHTIDDFMDNMFGLALIAQKFTDNDILTEFEINPKPIVDSIIKELDITGNGKIEKWEFIKRAPEVLFNKEFFHQAGELYTESVYTERLERLNIKDSHLAEPKIFQQILKACPSYLYWMDWQKLYDISIDGCSMSTLQNKIKTQRETLFIIKTTEGEIFGTYNAEKLKFDSNLHGNTDYFLWVAKNERVVCFKNKNNEYQNFFTGDRESIRWGTDENDCSLYIGEEFSRGSCGTSHTYGSHPPLSENKEFRISGLEVWGPVD